MRNSKSGIQEVYTSNHRVHEARKIWRELNRQGHAVTHCTVEHWPLEIVQPWNSWLTTGLDDEKAPFRPTRRWAPLRARLTCSGGPRTRRTTGACRR
ncbi:IS3 family transposase [Streptomyces akebiae]|uniref:IS3 family transposase n=1 Tax=Streptomyces akebiae TaxID=2865673 RepID=UPI0037D9EA2B